MLHAMTRAADKRTAGHGTSVVAHGPDAAPASRNDAPDRHGARLGNQALLRMLHAGAMQRPNPALQRKCACGGSAGMAGGCAGCAEKHENAMALPGLQAKLSVSKPGDPLEHEADHVADAVMRMPEPRVARDAAIPLEGERSGHPDVGRRAVPSSDGSITELVSSIGPGQPLGADLRSFFEPRFGVSFENVRLHADAKAAASARAFHAQAYTAGVDIVFGSGQFSPDTSEGKRLLAHELTHVAQQGHGEPLAGSGKRDPIAEPAGAGEAPAIARQEELGDAISQVKEENKDPHEIDRADAAAIGEEILRTVGYEELIHTATEAGLLERKDTAEAGGEVQRQTAPGADMIFRQTGAEVLTFGAVFTRYAVAAGITSQLDSPAPGPADVVALGILAVGLAVASYTVLSRDACDAQLVACLNNVWQPDWNRGTFGPRKDCGACNRECKHAGGAWPYYKCPS